MKTASPFFAAIFALTFGAAALAQAPTQPAEHEHGHGPMPPPTNLQVLPKDMTGEQVHELMHKWEAELGTECSTCHAADPDHKRPDGRPMLNFAADTKQEKTTARLMVKMVEEINSQYIGKIDNSGMPVSCATCHRGHINPPPFVAPPDHDHDHAAPPAKPHTGQ